MVENIKCRSSRPEVFCKKGVFRNFVNFTEKRLRPATSLKKRFWHSCFTVNFMKFLKHLFFQNASDSCFSKDLLKEDPL